MPKCVAIEVADDGTCKVGELPPGATAQYAQAMQPAGSVDEALQAAGQMLGGSEEQGEQPPDKNAMWNKVQADRAMAGQPGGPMMGQRPLGP